MLGKITIALMVVASPALAAETSPSAQATEAPQFTTKKVCRTVEVAGSFIPRTSCVKKKIPVKKAPAADPQPVSSAPGEPAQEAPKDQ